MIDPQNVSLPRFIHQIDHFILSSHLPEPIQVRQGRLHVGFDQVPRVQLDVHKVLHCFLTHPVNPIFRSKFLLDLDAIPLKLDWRIPANILPRQRIVLVANIGHLTNAFSTRETHKAKRQLSNWSKCPLRLTLGLPKVLEAEPRWSRPCQGCPPRHPMGSPAVAFEPPPRSRPTNERKPSTSTSLSAKHSKVVTSHFGPRAWEHGERSKSRPLMEFSRFSLSLGESFWSKPTSRKSDGDALQGSLPVEQCHLSDLTWHRPSNVSEQFLTAPKGRQALKIICRSTDGQVLGMKLIIAASWGVHSNT